MFNTCVFVDSTLPIDELNIFADRFTIKPAAKRGDVILALKEGFKRLVIVDGNFDFTASIWHQEIMYALSKNIEVIGVSSIGALRAAELHSYGMKGYGKVYEYYKESIVSGDDEVAIGYDPAYGAVTVPLINLRFTIEKIGLGNDVLERLKKIFYKMRTWGRIKKELGESIANRLKSGYLDQKCIDAKNCLIDIANTHVDLPVYVGSPPSVFLKKLVVERCFKRNEHFLALSFPLHDFYMEYKQRAKKLSSFLGYNGTESDINHLSNLIAHSWDFGVMPSDKTLHKYIGKYREAIGLYKKEDLLSWLKMNDLSPGDLMEVLTDYVLLSKLFYANFSIENIL